MRNSSDERAHLRNPSYFLSYKRFFTFIHPTFCPPCHKILLLREMGIKDSKIQESIINFAEQNRYIFTKWTKFDLNKELQAKISQEVYS